MNRRVQLWMVVSFLFLGARLPAGAQSASPAVTDEYNQWLSQAVAAFSAGKLPEVLKDLEVIEKIHPGQKEAKNLKGAVLVRLNKFDEALAVFQEVSASDPKDADAYFNQAECLFLKKDFAVAKKSFQMFQSLNKEAQKSLLASYQIFLCDLMLGNEAAVKSALAATEVSLTNPIYYYEHAAASYKEGKAKEGRDFVASAFRIYSSQINAVYVDALVNLGFLQQSEITSETLTYLPPASRRNEPLRKIGGQAQEVPATGINGLVPNLDPGATDKDKKKKP